MVLMNTKIITLMVKTLPPSKININLSEIMLSICITVTLMHLLRDGLYIGIMVEYCILLCKPVNM